MMPKSILIADDHDTVRKLTRLFLETQIDLEVCGEAVDGVEAIEKAKQLKPDLVVMDLAMPRLNGVEAALVLKGLMPRMPIVVFTLYSELVSSSLSSMIGVDAVLSKPDGGWKLVECVRSLLA
jgi:two-component system, NarL family, response regulator LiaR